MQDEEFLTFIGGLAGELNIPAINVVEGYPDLVEGEAGVRLDEEGNLYYIISTYPASITPAFESQTQYLLAQGRLLLDGILGHAPLKTSAECSSDDERLAVVNAGALFEAYANRAISKVQRGTFGDGGFFEARLKDLDEIVTPLVGHALDGHAYAVRNCFVTQLIAEYFFRELVPTIEPAFPEGILYLASPLRPVFDRIVEDGGTWQGRVDLLLLTNYYATNFVDPVGTLSRGVVTLKPNRVAGVSEAYHQKGCLLSPDLLQLGRVIECQLVEAYESIEGSSFDLASGTETIM